MTQPSVAEDISSCFSRRKFALADRNLEVQKFRKRAYSIGETFSWRGGKVQMSSTSSVETLFEFRVLGHDAAEQP